MNAKLLTIAAMLFASSAVFAAPPRVEGAAGQVAQLTDRNDRDRDRWSRRYRDRERFEQYRERLRRNRDRDGLRPEYRGREHTERDR